MGWIADLLKEIPSAARYKSELEAMEKELSECRLTKKQLELDNVNLRQEIQRRDDIVQKEKSHGHILEEVREKILLFIAQRENLSDAQIAEAIGIGKQLATFHLEELETSKLVRSASRVDDDHHEINVWSVAPDGRRYLASHGLIS